MTAWRRMSAGGLTRSGADTGFGAAQSTAATAHWHSAGQVRDNA